MSRRSRSRLIVAIVVVGSILTSSTPNRGATDAAPAAACTAGYHSGWTAQSAYPTLSPGQTARVEIDFQNIGCNTWSGNARLGTWNPTPGQDQPSVLGGAAGCAVVTDWSGCTRLAPFNGSTFAYGQVAQFIFTVKAPQTPGTYKVYLRPLLEGVTWMEDQGVYMQVNDLLCTNRSPHDNGARQTHNVADVPAISIISSDITEYDPYYTGQNSTGTNASILLVRQTPSLQWAQLGWLKSKLDNGSVQREVFVELWVNSIENFYQFWPGKPVGTSTWYQIQYAGAGYYDFYVGGTFYTDMGGWGDPTQYQIMGETHDYVDQGPGAINQHVAFDNSQYQYTGGPGWIPVTTPMTADTSVPWNVSNPSTGHYEIWDASCAN